MGKDTGIEWADHTFNPWMGCTKVSPACDFCYAEKLVTGRMGLPVWGKDALRRETSTAYWHQPFAWDRAARESGVRARVFCGSLCDVMEDREDQALSRIRGDLWQVIESTEWLDWLLVTKRPQNYRKFLPARWIESPRANVWGMTTVESSEYLWRVEELSKVPFAVRGLSMEPLLGPVDLAAGPSYPLSIYREAAVVTDRLIGPSGVVQGMPRPGRADYVHISRPPLIDWVIAGGETGAEARPTQLDWVRSLRDQCVDAGVAFLFKQWGEWQPVGAIPGGGNLMVRVGKKKAGRLLDGREWNEVPRAVAA